MHRRKNSSGDFHGCTQGGGGGGLLPVLEISTNCTLSSSNTEPYFQYVSSYVKNFPKDVEGPISQPGVFINYPWPCSINGIHLPSERI